MYCGEFCDVDLELEDIRRVLRGCKKLFWVLGVVWGILGELVGSSLIGGIIV